LNPIMEIAKRHNLKVIEDGAQAIGTEDTVGRRVGSIGDIGCFSFFPSKNLGGFGDGGMVTTNDPELFQTLTYMRNHGAHPKYYHKMIGGNFRLDAIQGAVLDVKLKHLDDWTAARQQNADYYDKEFKRLGLSKHIKLPTRISGRRHIFNQYIIQIEKRDNLLAHLKSKNIGSEVYYPVTFNNQECFAYLGYKKGDFPIAERAAAETMAIPIYPELTREQQDYVLDAIVEFYKK